MSLLSESVHCGAKQSPEFCRQLPEREIASSRALSNDMLSVENNQFQGIKMSNKLCLVLSVLLTATYASRRLRACRTPTDSADRSTGSTNDRSGCNRSTGSTNDRSG